MCYYKSAVNFKNYLASIVKWQLHSAKPDIPIIHCLHSAIKETVHSLLVSRRILCNELGFTIRCWVFPRNTVWNNKHSNPSLADRSNWEPIETLENKIRNYMFKSKHLKIIILSISI